MPNWLKQVPIWTGDDWTRGRNDYLRCWNDQGRLFKILDNAIHWKGVSTGQLLIQWTASYSRWIKLVVQKQWQWLASYSLDKILFQWTAPMILCTFCLWENETKNKKGPLCSATFQVIFHAVKFICWIITHLFSI